MKDRVTLGDQPIGQVQEQVEALLKPGNRAIFAVLVDEDGEIHAGMGGSLARVFGGAPDESRVFAATILVMLKALEQCGLSFEGIKIETELDS